LRARQKWYSRYYKTILNFVLNQHRWVLSKLRILNNQKNIERFYFFEDIHHRNEIGFIALTTTCNKLFVKDKLKMKNACREKMVLQVLQNDAHFLFKPALIGIFQTKNFKVTKEY